MIDYLKSHKKAILYSIGIIAVAFTLLVFRLDLLFTIRKDENKIGWMTDIHAGANKKRAFAEEDGSDNTLYPKQFREYFPAALRKLKSQGVGTVVITGDSSNLTEYHYAQELKKMADESGLKVVWVRGNHDFLPGKNKDIMKEFGVEDYFYHYDTDEYRLIVLDVNFNGPRITEENINWLKARLDETYLPVIIASHTPLVDYPRSEPYAAYQTVFDTIVNSGKVVFAISGHTHKDAEMEKSGVIFRTAWPLTQKDHKGSFYIIDIKDKKIELQENWKSN